jgi:hypothetical protein
MSDTAPLPTLMCDDDLEREIAARRREPYDPFRRKERPDPWPIIASRFPRIAEAIRSRWGTGRLDAYFSALVIDDRGGRAGFPPDVLAAILEVARLHGDRFRTERLVCPWSHDASLSKWWDRG